MKIKMKTSEEKCGSGGGSNSGNAKIRIAVIGQHEVGKSALTVRYLTRRYIGEYKSNADLLYRQTLTVSHGSSLDIEIMDISTSEQTRSGNEQATFPQERADAFIIVYSITDRSSFTFALQTLSTLSNYQNLQQQQQHQQQQQQMQQQMQQQNQQQNQNSPPLPPSKPFSIVLLANKSDLEHLRTVEKVEGVGLAMQYGCNFYEVSVADNSPELYQSFHTIISNFTSQNQTTSKRKFSVSKMLGNLRIGRTSPCQQVLSQASIIDTSTITTTSTSSSLVSSSSPSDSMTTTTTTTTTAMTLSSTAAATSPSASCCSSSPNSDTKSSSNCGNGNGKVCVHQRNSDPNSSGHQNHGHSHNNISSSICNLKSKLVEFHSLKKRHNSPPICSL